MASRENEQHGLRLLSFDGGGIRGISELVILDEIMKRVEKIQNLPSPALPCDYFDLICGTSTGGLIAILLGRLKMSVPEAIGKYRTLAKVVFSQRKAFGKDGLFKASKLEGAIKDVLKAQLGSGKEEEGMLEQDLESKRLCRVFVCAMAAQHIESNRPRLFRTYRVDKNEEDDCAIWKAGRATSAAPMLFKPMQIGHEGIEECFVDAALGCNNPVKQLVSEAEVVFGDSRDVACIVSIGSGRPKVTGFKQHLGWDIWQRVVPVDLISAIKKMATDSEATAEQMANDCKHFDRLYYRLNVEHGLEHIGLDEWETLGEVKTHTKAYLNQPHVSQKIDEIVAALVGTHSPKYMLRQLGAARPNPEQHQIYDYPKGVSKFVNRERPLKEIAAVYQGRHDEVDPMVVILHGMGGSGKTQLALKYCRQSMDTQRHNSIFWVDASTPKTTAQSFAAIEGLIFNCKVDLSKVEASVKRVVAEMSKWQTAWLIVFDNFDEPSLFDDEGKNIRDYFPRGKRGSILFTTRNEGTGRLGHMIEVNRMTEDEGLELLAQTSGKKSIVEADRNDGKDIINRLGYFALAIDQAGAYIRARNLAPGLFIDHFNNRKEKILKEIPALWEYTKKLSDAETVTAVSVFTTWEMSFQQIKGDGDQKMKKEHLLTTSAFLDHRYIHQALFGCYFAHSSPEWMSIFTVDGVYVKYEFGDVLAEFKLLSLLEYVEVHLETGIHFVIHPLIQDWIKLRLTFEECQNYIIETIDILAAYVSGCDFIAMTLQSRQALVAHLNVSMENNDHYRTKRLENPEMKYAAFKFASFYQSEGFYAKAEKLFSMSIAAGESQVGLEDPETLKMMGHLATIYSLQGKYSQAEKLYLEVLDGFKAQLGDNDISTIHSLHNLSLLYQQLDRYDEAERLGKQALELKTKILGRKDPSTLRSASCLATTYKLQGRYDEAENLYTRALNDINLQGEGHGWVAALDICQALATMHRLRRRFEEAEYWSKEILKLREQEFGPDHPSTCDTMAELGLVFKERNRNAEAMELFRRALRGNETVLGVDNPSTVNVRNELELLQNQEG